MRDFVAERNAKSEIAAVFKLFYNEFKIMLQNFLFFSSGGGEYICQPLHKLEG